MRDLFALCAIQIEKSLGVGTPAAHVLCYHSVSKTDSLVNVTPSQFKKQMRYILTHFDVVPLSEIVHYIDGKRKVTKPIVAVTFDDGYQNLLSIAPYLQTLGIIPTIFVTSEPNRINRRELANNHPIMASHDLRYLHEKYGWEVGSHTATHPNLLVLNDQDLAAEIIQSKHQLENELGIDIKYFAYPKGYFNRHIVSVCQTAKYEGAFTTKRSLISPKTNPLTIHRLGIDRTTSMKMFPFMFTHSALIYFGTKQMCNDLINQSYDFTQSISNFARHTFANRIRA